MIRTRPESDLAKARRRRGVLTIEMVLVTPILLALLLALVQFAIVLMSHQAVQAAASVGARQAMLPSAAALDVEAAVAQVVGGWPFAGQQTVAILVNGVPEELNPLDEALTGDEILVEVRVPMEAAAPDLLQFIGMSISGKYLQSTYLVRKE